MALMDDAEIAEQALQNWARLPDGSVPLYVVLSFKVLPFRAEDVVGVMVEFAVNAEHLAAIKAGKEPPEKIQFGFPPNAADAGGTLMIHAASALLRTGAAN